MRAAFDVSDRDDQQWLFKINASVSAAIVYLALGGVLVYQAASSFGGTTSGPAPLRSWRWLTLFLLFPGLLIVGQIIVDHPGGVPWLFPFVNVAIVSIPSFTVASLVTARYMRANPLSWPVSGREWVSGIAYGAIGAIGFAVVINTISLILLGVLFIEWFGHGDAWDLGNLGPHLRALPRGWGIVYDLGILSVLGPMDEEFWKGFLVALFFFRKGSAGRCYLWGVLAGSGFNLIETFQGSIGVIDPDIVRSQTIDNQWWLFALARVGGAVLHAGATGFSALAFYGLFRRQWRFLLGYPAGVFLHGSWNASVYLTQGDAFFSRQGPDSTLFTVLGITGMVLVFAECLLGLWFMSVRLRDAVPAPVYRLLGMAPGAPRGDVAASGTSSPVVAMAPVAEPP